MVKITSYCETGNQRNCILVTDDDTNEFYFSYNTLIAFKKPEMPIVVMTNYWNNTTGKHLNAIPHETKNRVSMEEFDKKYIEYFD